MTRRGGKGFTIIELLVVVAIVGILAAVAWPAYTGRICRTRQANGDAYLQEVRIAMEKYRSRENAYLAANGNLSVLGMNVTADNQINYGDTQSRYSMTITRPTTPGQRLTFIVVAKCLRSKGCQLDGDTLEDERSIDQTGKITVVRDDCD